MRHRAGAVCAFGLLLNSSLMGLVLCMSGNVAAVTWDIETVDSTGDVGMFSHLALDSNGYAHIAYFDYSSDDVKYAHWTGSSWIKNTVGPTGAYGFDGGSTAIALDSSGTPHISYYYSTNLYSGQLKYAKWTGSTWSVTTVDLTGDAGITSSIAVDSNGHPSISYYDYENGDLKYAEWTGSSWSLSTVESTDNVGLFTTLALDSSDHPHIAYTYNTMNILRYAEWNGSGWSVRDVDSVGEYGGTASIALSSAGQPRISYYYSSSESTGSLRFAEWTGSAWSITTVDSDGDMGVQNSLALDPADNPHLAYYDMMNGVLKYAEWSDLGWNISVVDWDSDVGWFASMVYDASGNPQISYYDATRGNLKLAKGVSGNMPPNRPPAPSGPSWGHVGSSHTFSVKTMDPNADQINYTFDWGDGESSWTGLMPSGTTASLSHSWSIIGTYDVTVLAEDEHYMCTDWSPPLSVMISSVDSPGPPTGVTASAQDRAVSLSWSPPSDDGGHPIVNYTVYRGTSPGWESPLVKLGNVSSYDDAGLTNGQTYYYRITANNTVMEGPLSTEVNATPATVPSAPVLNATAGDRYVNLEWSPPSYDGGSPVTRYDVYRDGNLITSTSARSYSDTGLANGVTYTYTVRAVNAMGSGQPSNAVTVSPKAAGPTSILQETWFMLLILMVIVIVIVAIAVAAFKSSRKRQAVVQPPVVPVRQPLQYTPARYVPPSRSVSPPPRSVSQPPRSYAPRPPPPPPEYSAPAAPKEGFTESKCPYCGSNLAAGSTFCVMCGRRIG